MPNFNGMWTSRQQMQARGANLWPATPGAPTSVSATAGDAQATVSFTAPTDTGYPAGITGYRVTASPGGLTTTGASSPITITGLTNGISYTFTVAAQNANGYGFESEPSGSVTPLAPQQVAYTSAGAYTFIVPSGLSPNSLSVVCVGAGGSSGYANSDYYAGGGGGLRYRNNITGLSAGQSISLVVGPANSWGDGGNSSFGTSGVDSFYVFAQGGYGGGYGGTTANSGLGGTGTTIGGDVGGGNGGSARGTQYGGGGAGGYSGNGGSGNGSSGSGGAGGGGGSGSNASGGGGVGILGEGASGTGGVGGSSGGGGGSGGTNGGSGASSGYTANGGLRGGGAGGAYTGTTSYGFGGGGAVRIIYSTLGVTRSFPSTNTGDL